MACQFLDALSLPQRLALSYAPASARGGILTLLSLDNRLAAVLRSRGEEPIIAQMKLAWWRDRLADDPANWPTGEPLLARLAAWNAPPVSLLPLVNGWEMLLADDLDTATVEEYAAGRSAAWGALAGGLGQGGLVQGGLVQGGGSAAAVQAAVQAAREWALADLALNLGAGAEADTVRAAANCESWASPALPRALRPLAVLRGLSGRALRRRSADLLDSPAAALLALRIGITGR